MTYSQEIGTALAESVQEMVLLDELNLMEIRDIKTLENHIKAASKKYGSRHPKYKALLALHAKKQVADQRKKARHAHIKERQEHHAKRYGYKRVKGGKDEWYHPESGHKLSFSGDRSWSHVKSGRKRPHGGNATPIRALHQHLKSLHEDVELVGQDLQEIRAIERLGGEINKNLLVHNPVNRERLFRLQALKRRKMAVAMMGMHEKESPRINPDLPGGQGKGDWHVYHEGKHVGGPYANRQQAKDEHWDKPGAKINRGTMKK